MFTNSWDPLRVCAVGRSYPPEFYSFIKNSRVRSVMERIAEETEEDYQKLIKLLESFNVDIVRNDIPTPHEECFVDGKYLQPPMVPRDYTAMIGETFFMPSSGPPNDRWDIIKGTDWTANPPQSLKEFQNLSDQIKYELNKYGIKNKTQALRSIEELISIQGNKIIYGTGINTAEVSRIGKDLYFGTPEGVNINEDIFNLQEKYTRMFPNYRCHVINTSGHSDSTFCPIIPGLIVSRYDIPTYADTFPGWEVVYLPNQSWEHVKPFLDLKEKNRGKWWVPGEELNDDFTEFVEGWLSHWVGYVEETVFDVNMLVIDEKNVVCNNYNEQVFAAFARHGVTPHIVNFRHRYFWDGGLHCITSDLHRDGVQKDYFPERGLT